MPSFFSTMKQSTCICACVGCVSCLCCCDNTDRHNLDDTGEVVSYRALSCNGTARSHYLRRHREERKDTVKQADCKGRSGKLGKNIWPYSNWKSTETDNLKIQPNMDGDWTWKDSRLVQTCMLSWPLKNWYIHLIKAKNMFLNNI